MSNKTSLKNTDYIYKIAPSDPKPLWTANDKSNRNDPVLEPSALDTQSGFIHMSEAAQIPGNLKHFFPSDSGKRDSIWLLKVRITEDHAKQNELRWESPDASVCGQRDDEGLFPHLYFAADAAQRGLHVDNGRRLFLRKGEVESVLEVVSEPNVSGYDVPLQTDEVKQWLI